MVNLQIIAYWDSTLVGMLSLCAALGTIKFFKILEFNSSIKTLARAFQIGFLKTLGFVIVFTLMVFAWLQFGFVIFNDRIHGFSTFVKTIESGFLLILGKFQLSDMLIANPYWTILFHVSFNICVIFVMFDLFLTIICDSLNAAKEDERSSQQLPMYDFLTSKMFSAFKALKDIVKKPPEGRDQEKREKKNDEMENFANRTDEIIRKIQNFNAISYKDENTKRFEFLLISAYKNEKTVN
jgi:hypothetical protein